MSRMSGPLNRVYVIDLLEKKHNITRVVIENLCRYMDNTRRYRDGNRN